MTEIKLNPRDIAINKIVELLEKNPEAWQKTWEHIGTSRPYNPITKSYYKGVNMFTLGLVATDYCIKDNRWCTFDQAKHAGHPVSKGETSKAIVVYHQINHTVSIRDNKYEFKNKPEQEVCRLIVEAVIKNYPEHTNATMLMYEDNVKLFSLSKSSSELLVADLKNKLKLDITQDITTIARYAPVFNYSQLENAPAIEISPGYKWNPCERAEQIIKSSNIPIYHDQINRNYYRAGVHDIHLTIKSSFKTPEAYYATALHELSHAKINDGTLKLSFDPSQYNASHIARAREELRAELSSIFICADIGLNYNVQNHTAYLHSWLKIFKEHKSELWTAVSESNRISDAIFKREREFVNSLSDSKKNIIEKDNSTIESESMNIGEIPVTSNNELSM